MTRSNRSAGPAVQAAPGEAGSSTLTAVTMVPGRPDDGDELARADHVGTALAVADAENAERAGNADHPGGADRDRAGHEHQDHEHQGHEHDDEHDDAPTMSWWQDAGGVDDHLTADETAVAAVTEVATVHFPALAVQGLLLTGDRAAGEEVVYEALARLRRDWYRLADPDQATAYLQGAVTALARQRTEPGGTSTSTGSAATATDLDADGRRTPPEDDGHLATGDDRTGEDHTGEDHTGEEPVTHVRPDVAASGVASTETSTDTGTETDTGTGTDTDTDAPAPVDVRAALAAVATDAREGLVLHHHLNLPEHETALCLCTAVAPLRSLLTGGITQLRTVLGDPVAGYDDQRLAGLVASAGSDVVATLDRDRLASALTGTRRLAVVPRRRRRVDAAFLLLGILVGGAVAVGAVWRSHSGTSRTAAVIRPAVVSTIVGGRAGSTTLVTAARTAAAPTTVAITTVAPTTTPTTTAEPTPANDVLAVAITPPPTDVPIPTATTRATAPARTPVTTVASATTAQTAPPVPTASPTTAPAPATTVAATAPPATVAPTTPAPPTTPAATTAQFRGWSIAQYGCARSDSSFFASGTADPAGGSVAVTGPGFSLTSPISASGTWRVSTSAVTATQQGSFTFRAATTSGPGARQSQNVVCS